MRLAKARTLSPRTRARQSPRQTRNGMRVCSSAVLVASQKKWPQDRQW